MAQKIYQWGPLAWLRIVVVPALASTKPENSSPNGDDRAFQKCGHACPSFQEHSVFTDVQFLDSKDPSHGLIIFLTSYTFINSLSINVITSHNITPHANS